MIKLLDKSKVPFFDYFFLFCIIIYAGMASAFTRQFGDIRTVGNAVPLVLTIVFTLYKRIKINSKFLIVIGIYSLYSLLVVVATGSATYFLWEYSKWLMIFYIAYAICEGYGLRFFLLAETILYHLAVIGIACWVILMIIPGPFTRFISFFSLAPFNEKEFFTSANVLVYTVILSSAAGDFESWYSIIRNSGFAWEPGAFACYLNFGICFNAIRTNMELKNNRALLVFLIALASTQSTTGYVTLLIMLAVWLIDNRRFMLISMLVPVGLLIMNLPFMKEKILFEVAGFADTSLANAQPGESFDRLLSFRILWDEFLKHPILGYGFSEPDFMKYELQTWSGLGHMLAQYGLVLSSMFLLLLVKTYKNLCILFSNRSSIMIIVAMLGSMISYMIWATPFCVAIWLSGLFIIQPTSPSLPINNVSSAMMSSSKS